MSRTSPLVKVAITTLGALVLVGCAAATNQATGEIVIGFGVGRLVETGNAVLRDGVEDAINTVAPGWGKMVAYGGGALATLASSIWGVRQYGQRRDLSGQASGWDEREKVGVAQQPLLPPQTLGDGDING